MNKAKKNQPLVFSSQQLISPLLKHAGASEPSLQEENVCLMAFEPNTHITIKWTSQIIRLSCAVGSVKDSLEYQQLIRSVLEYNLNSCTSSSYQYAIDAKGNQLILYAVLPSNEFTPNSFIEYFIQFKTDADLWIEHLNANKIYIPEALQQTDNLSIQTSPQQSSSVYG